MLCATYGSVIRQPVYQADTQEHDHQTYRNDDEQGEAEPS